MDQRNTKVEVKPLPTFLVVSNSPLQIRTTIHRLRHTPCFWKLLRKLLNPYPWYFKLPPYADVASLQAGGADIIEERHTGLAECQWIPIYKARDTPLRCLYRMMEEICADRVVLMGYDCMYYFFHTGKRWRLANCPDPKDPDPIRYAILACLVEELVKAFNWRLELGLRHDHSKDFSENRATNFERERVPDWAASVPPIENFLQLTYSQEGIKFSPYFTKRNLGVCTGHLYNI
ncbi:hypothetical protein TRICI_006381 [Trichomonascus ciferrii]|uniref:Uncharacterized protein n=1 Tax=Trichomonascus ciferrii TaxID=44093 RepID=A0A642UHD6_9ASCO|nr:hypothetical protein TRICI_006381 [Trichomonascus ciferrii]